MKKHNSKHFTLIEMMVVIAIIAILAGILFPVVISIREKAKAKETQTLLSSIGTAIIAFKGDHKYLPYGTSEPTKDTTFGKFNINDPTAKPDNNYCTFFNVLTYSDHTDKEGEASSAVKKINTQGIPYLSAPASYYSDNDQECNMRDSWDQQLVVKVDYDGDGVVKIESSDVGGANNARGTFKESYVVVSAGHQTGDKLDKDEFIFQPTNK